MTKSRRRAWVAATVFTWTFAVTIARAFRFPNDFAEAHWLLDYRFGFIKRGLIGSICTLATSLSGFKMNPALITILSSLALCALSGAIVWLFLQTIRRHQVTNGILVLGVVFASSPFVVMSGHLLGYFDTLLYTLAIVSIALVLRGRPLPAAVVSSLAILVHESYLVIGLPLVCLASVCALTTGRARGQSGKSHIIGICVPITVFLGVSLLQSQMTDAMVLHDQLLDRLNSFGFVASRSEQIAAWQTTSFMLFLRQEIGVWDERLLNPQVLASVAPTLLAILAFIHSAHRIRPFSPFSIMVLVLVCAPLSMHAVAWDTGRISIYTIGGGYIALWILGETRAARPTDNLILLIALPALILNVFGRVSLMDGEADRFSNRARLLIYLPAIALAARPAFESLGRKWFEEFSTGKIARNAIEGDE